ncbi:MAG: GNAT family N-acetyltransferase [Thermoplasmata archaeon]
MPNSLAVTIRPPRWEDFDELREIYFHLYDERAAGAPIGITLFDERPTPADETVWFQTHYRRALEGQEIWLVAERDGHAVGNCTIVPVVAGPPSEQSHVGELGILVHHGYRGTGVGTALLERALAVARSRFELVLLSVFTVNEGALRLYRRFGFTVSGHLPKVVKRGEQYFDEERMVLDFSTTPLRPEANR